MIRFTILLIFLIIYFIVSIPFMLIELIIGQFNINARNVICLKWVQFAFKCVMIISGLKTEVHGLENIPKDQASLFVSNHRSYYDIIVTYPCMKRPMGYIAKKQMKKIPFLSWMMYFVNCLFLDRDNPREGLKTILKGADNIKSGVSMFICPEGTRSKTNEMLPFKDGSLKMATKTKCPIIPVGITGTDAIFEQQAPRIRPGKVIVSFGRPIYTADLSKEQLKTLNSDVQNTVAQILEKNKQYQ